MFKTIKATDPKEIEADKILRDFLANQDDNRVRNLIESLDFNDDELISHLIEAAHAKAGVLHENGKAYVDEAQSLLPDQSKEAVSKTLGMMAMALQLSKQYPDASGFGEAITNSANPGRLQTIFKETAELTRNMNDLLELFKGMDQQLSEKPDGPLKNSK